MKHIKKFESYGNQEVSKINEEFDLATVGELFNQFMGWLQNTHMDGTGEYYANWEAIVGVLGALGLTSPLLISAIRSKKEDKEKLNKMILDKVKENPDRDPKEIAKEVEEEFNKANRPTHHYRVGGGAPL